MSNPRLFTTNTQSDPSALVTYDPFLGYTHLNSNRTCIVVSTDGACRRNGYSNAEDSYGIYFGRNSPFNTCSLVPTNIREHGTNNIAELYAAFMGIYHAFDIRKAVFKFDGFKINQIIVKTDSSYLSETLSKHVWNWSWDAEAWAYRNARGKRRANSVIIHEIHKQIQAIAGHTKVKFWRVRREQNADADRLANIALDGRFEERYGMPLEASLPWLPWQSSSHYLTTDPKKLLVIDEVIQRLELPLEPDNQWSRSVASFLVLQIMNSVYDRISDDEPAVHSRVRAICKNGVIYSQVLKLYFGANWEVEFERGASTFGVQLFTSFSGLSKEWKKRLFEKDFDLYNLYIEIAGRKLVELEPAFERTRHALRFGSGWRIRIAGR